MRTDIKAQAQRKEKKSWTDLILTDDHMGSFLSFSVSPLKETTESLAVEHRSIGVADDGSASLISQSRINASSETSPRPGVHTRAKRAARSGGETNGAATGAMEWKISSLHSKSPGSPQPQETAASAGSSVVHWSPLHSSVMSLANSHSASPLAEQQQLPLKEEQPQGHLRVQTRCDAETPGGGLVESKDGAKARREKEAEERERQEQVRREKEPMAVDGSFYKIVRGSNGSVGLTFKRPQGSETGPFEVVHVVPAGAASFSGIKVGTFFDAVGGVSVCALTNQEVAALIKGKPSTSVELSVCNPPPLTRKRETASKAQQQQLLQRQASEHADKRQAEPRSTVPQMPLNPASLSVAPIHHPVASGDGKGTASSRTGKPQAQSHAGNVAGKPERKSELDLDLVAMWSREARYVYGGCNEHGFLFA